MDERGPGGTRAGAHDLARVQVELAARVADVTRLGSLGSPLRSMTDIQSALDEVLRTVTALLGAGSGVLMLYDPERDELFPRASLGVPDEQLAVLSPVPRPVGVRGTGLATVEPLVMEDVRLSPLSARYAAAAEHAGVRALYSTPLLTLGNELMGTIAAFFDRPHRPSEREIELVEAYARQAAEMVERARMHGEARLRAALERQRAAQLRRLADAALAVSSAATVDEVLRIVTEAARDVIGVHQGVATRLFAGWDDATTYVSLSEKYAEWRDYDEVPKGLGVLNAVTRENRPLRLSRDQLPGHPEWRGLRDAPGHPPLPGYLAAPLVARDGRNLGLVQLSDKADGSDFTEEDESALVQLAQMASVAVENLELVERERAARAEAENNARLRGLLADASRAFAASLELDETLGTISELTVPGLADWISVHLLAETGEVEAAYVHHHDPERERALRELLDTHGAGDAAGPVAHLAAAHHEPVAAHLVVPLRARGREFGRLALVREQGDPYTEAEHLLARELADRAALAVDNAARFAFERDVAATLQRALLPQELPLTPAVDAASRYQPGSTRTGIGGDWYDVIELDNGLVGMVVGDVMGRGVTAAAVMGQLRAAVRAYALEGHEPAQLLQRLDRLVQALDQAQLTTCLYAVYDPDTGRLTVSGAGHLPPLVVPGEGAPWFLDIEPGVPLGVGDSTFTETTVDVGPGTVLLLYTDGLVESPESPVDDGMAALRAAVPGRWESLDALCDHVLAKLRPDGHDEDDSALLAICFTGAGGNAHVYPVLELAPRADSVAIARRFVRDRLCMSNGPDLVGTAELLVSELVTNAVRHARSAFAVRLVTLPHVVRVAVSDESAAPPEPRELVDEEAEGGRGMVLVDALAERWGYERLLSGKRVWFELARG